MSHVLFIDDGICGKHIGKRLQASICIDDNLKVVHDFNPNFEYISHGSICASILLKYAPDSIISSIKIMDSGEKSSCDKLFIALSLVNDIRPNIVNISLGSTFKFDYDAIKSILKKIDPHIIIVASLSNKFLRTYPASLSEVISTSSVSKKICNIKMMKYSVVSNNVICNSRHDIFIDSKNTLTMGCNSFASPFLCSVIAKIISKDICSRRTILHRLYAELYGKTDVFSCVIPDFVEKPIIVSDIEVSDFLPLFQKFKMMQIAEDIQNDGDMFDTLIIINLKEHFLKENLNGMLKRASLLKMNIVIIHKYTIRIDWYDGLIWETSLYKQHFNKIISRKVKVPILCIKTHQVKNICKIYRIFSKKRFPVSFFSNFQPHILYGMYYLPFTEKNKNLQVIATITHHEASMLAILIQDSENEEKIESKDVAEVIQGTFSHIVRSIYKFFRNYSEIDISEDGI